MIAVRSNQNGFSAVELLITLFIGAIFLFAGYQLYTYVFRSGIEASQRATASMVAYKYLRNYQDTTQTGACSATTPVNNQTLTGTGLNKASVTVTVTCPFSTNPQIKGVSLITANVTYTSPSQVETVSHAGYSY